MWGNLHSSNKSRAYLPIMERCREEKAQLQDKEKTLMTCSAAI